jgi:hypothetical protein
MYTFPALYVITLCLGFLCSYQSNKRKWIFHQDRKRQPNTTPVNNDTQFWADHNFSNRPTFRAHVLIQDDTWRPNRKFVSNRLKNLNSTNNNFVLLKLRRWARTCYVFRQDAWGPERSPNSATVDSWFYAVELGISLNWKSNEVKPKYVQYKKCCWTKYAIYLKSRWSGMRCNTEFFGPLLSFRMSSHTQQIKTTHQTMGQLAQLVVRISALTQFWVPPPGILSPPTQMHGTS